jgi:ankyrin repeat protein
MCLLQEGNLVSCAFQIASVPSYKSEGYSQHFTKQTTGLHLTATSGLLYLSRELLCLIMEGKAKPMDLKDSEGSTPLILATRYGHKDIVELLLSTGKVDVNAKNNDGWTPLMFTA